MNSEVFFGFAFLKEKRIVNEYILLFRAIFLRSQNYLGNVLTNRSILGSLALILQTLRIL